MTDKLTTQKYLLTRAKAASAMARIHHRAKQHVMTTNIDSLKTNHAYVSLQRGQCLTDNWLRVDIRTDAMTRMLQEALRLYCVRFFND